MSAVPNAFENVKAVILSAHKGTTSKEKVDFYNSWAENYDQDVAVLDYRAPRLAANSISSHFRGDREAAVLLDVACGTGLVARQLKNHGFGHFVGIDGSEAMLEVARESGLYQDLKQFLLGEEPLPVQWENAFDVVVIVGALSVGQVPVCVVRDLCKSTKPELPVNLSMFLDCGRKLEKTHPCTGRTCKVHAERAQAGTNQGSSSCSVTVLITEQLCSQL
ncbi:methyltransferase-like protein 27 isoform X2 [Acanthochromis polyacanthus]|uniref:methyltransferase-like protein 27 isoform X2 n=1 Tax=Acanthochromis polyacanthus TaxID=80966 RepID=UPI002234C27A|nr:methyltransferase-like protein 27 isoform X2 [Acanthochromis polyacanthus]